MSISDAIAPHIPFLRRFARALCGTQAAGDAYVAATLEAILADPDCFDAELDPKVALYKLFLRSWRNVPLNSHVDLRAFGDEGGANRNLAAISLEPRMAFLLSAVESFRPREIGQIIGCSEAEAAELIERAGQEISEQIRTTVLIIEDEPLIALDIQTLVEQLGHDVTTIARTHTEAVRAALEEPSGPYSGRHPTCRRKLGARRGQRDFGNSGSPGHFHNRLSRALSDRPGAGAGIPDHQALQRGFGQSGDQPSLILRSEVAENRGESGGWLTATGDARHSAWVRSRQGIEIVAPRSEP